MPTNDLLIRINSQFDDGGFKSAEASAKAMVAELDRQEKAERSLANMQAAAYAEDAARRERQLAAMASVGKGMTLIGLAAAAGLGLAAKSAADWESAWAGVTKVVDGSAEEMAALETQLRQLATTLPASHEEIAAVAEAAGQLGVKRQDIAGFTKTMIDLGVSTNLSAEDAASSLAKLGNIMGVLPSQADRAGAALVALGNDGASTESDIIDMSLRIAGAGKTIGLTEAQVMGFASALSSVGIEAEAGGSAISRVMVDISQAVNEGGKSLDQFAAVAGMSSAQFSTQFRVDAAGAITAFIAGLGRLQASGQDVFGTLDALGLSEIRVRDTLLRASQASDLLTHSVELGTSAWNDNAALVAEASKRYETAESRIAIARNRLNDAAIDIGGVILPAIANTADKVGQLAQVFTELPGPVQAGAVALGVIATGALLLGGAAMMAIPKLVALQATLAEMGPRGAAVAKGMSAVGGFLTGPWGLALAGAAVALGVFVNKQLEARAAVEQLSSTLDKQTGKVTAATSEMVAKNMLDALNPQVFKATADAAETSLGEMVDAVTKGGDSFAQLRARVEATQTQLAISQGTDAPVVMQLGKLLGVLDEMGGKVDASKQRLADVSGAVASTGNAAASAVGPTGDFSTGLTAVGDSATDAKTEVDKLIDTLSNLGQANVDARAAERDFQAAVDDAEKAVKENGKTLDVNTEKGRANQAALDDMRNAALKSAEAQLTMGTDISIVSGQVESARQTFISHAVAMGMDAGKAAALADQLGLTRANVDRLGAAINAVPGTKNTTITADTVNAQLQLMMIQRTLAGINDKTITIRTVTVAQHLDAISAGGAGGQAQGGVLNYAAGGSFSGQKPRIEFNRGPQGIRWAETGAGPWEAWISGNPANRDRSVDIWQDVGRRLGVLDQVASPQVVVAPQQAPSLAGLAITGTLDTPWGPAEIRGVVRDEIGKVGQMAAAGRRTV